ncbi:hypothetical protein ABBQ38_002152 [Trebouxia sp. C0009 RCD-2024]
MHKSACLNAPKVLSLPCQQAPPKLRARRGNRQSAALRPVRCVGWNERWNGNEPLPEKLSASSIRLCKPSECVDGLSLFYLCQSRPELKELKITSASFNSPVQGQWSLRSLRKLEVEFSDVPQDSHAVEQLLQHADYLYLKELRLKYTGPGFASLQASSLDKLHVENLVLEGFDIHKAAKLANSSGRLVDCILDVSQKDFDMFYKGAPLLVFERCRLPQHMMSWRRLTAGCVAAALLLLYLYCLTSHTAETLFIGGCVPLGFWLYDVWYK